MEKYRKIPREKEPICEDEIRITSAGRVLNYVSYAGKLFNEQHRTSFTIKATGNAIARAVTLAEIVKRRFKGLHQVTKCGSTTIADVYEPLEEGLDNVTHERTVSFLEITLSKEPLDESDPGYQRPIDENLVKEMSPEEVSGGRGVRGGRGGRIRGGGNRGNQMFAVRGNHYRRGGVSGGPLRGRPGLRRMYNGPRGAGGGRGGGGGGMRGGGFYSDQCPPGGDYQEMNEYRGRGGRGGMRVGRGAYRGGWRGGRY